MRLLLVLHLATFVWADPNCPAGYSNRDSVHCYKVYTTPTSRNAASAQCKADGGYLSSISNGFDNSYINSLGQSVTASAMWLGVKCYNTSTSSCVNDDGTSFGPYSNFYHGKPSALGYCVYMSNKKPSIAQWLSFDCDNLFPFVCEFDYGSRIAPKCPSGYEMFNNVCYKIVKTIKTRDAANNACRSIRGGNLATIPNDQVNQFLKSLLDEARQYVWFGLTCPNIRSTGDTSSCVWDDGTPFNYSSFYPNNPLPGYPYTFFDAGQWHNTDSSYIGPYFCQAPTI